MAAPKGGYTGKLLRVDLTNERIAEEPLDLEGIRGWVGGSGLGAKILYEEVPPSVAWSDAENRMIFANGPLSGTRAPGSGTFSVVTKGALTNGAATSQANGFFGCFLKFSGFDGIIVQGAAKRWLYLYVHDGTAELRDASHLLDLDTWQTQDTVTKDVGLTEAKLSVFSIGPAGEHLVKGACIAGDYGHIMGHNGVGAVMGSKKLKAICAARGAGVAEVYDKKAMADLAKEMLEDIKADFLYNMVYQYGTEFFPKLLAPVGGLPVKNYTSSVFPMEKALEYDGEYIRSHFEHKRHSCWACQMNHVFKVTIKEGPYAGTVVDAPEFEGLDSYGPQVGVYDVDATLMLANYADLMGLDQNESGWMVGLAMECYEKGVLTKEQLDGLDMTWGNVEAIKTLLWKIAHRDGIGDVLAEGVMRAAAKIGGDAPKFAIYTMKGNTPRSHDHRGYMFNELFDTCVSNTGTLEAGWMVQPADLADMGLLPAANFVSWEEVSTNCAALKGLGPFEDSLGVCKLANKGAIKRQVALLNAATGWDFTVEEAVRLGVKIVNLLRAYNVRNGHTRELDRPSQRYGEPPVDGPYAGLDLMSTWDQALDNYYEKMGWDKTTGKPLKETLAKLDLSHAAKDIW